MPKAKVSAEEVEETSTEETATESKKKKGAATTGPVPGVYSQIDGVVYDPNGQVMRTYTEEDHGETFEELATEFAAKQNAKRGL